MDMFDIIHEECPCSCVPDHSTKIRDDVDAARFVGFTKSESSESVKILSQECFQGRRLH